MSPVPRNARRARRAAVPIALTLAAVLAQPVAASEFPAGWEGYHTYAELSAEVSAVAATHPDIVSRFSIGKSYKGRDIWAVKVSDNVAVDEPEPEVLFDGGHHADEHMSVEMTLRILHWLADGYGTDARVTSLVDAREVWIVFNLNPDGSEFDILNGRFHHWRKNRQPTPGTTSIGTDLNRNYSYRWGDAGRTSADPASGTYHGTAPFSTPEAGAMRDFVASRVVGGRQQIRAAMTFHEYGRLVLWPYGYTTTDVPADMTRHDHAALVEMGTTMASTNGYRPEQGSDLYVSEGTSRDYLYGTYRMFVFTFELSAVDYPGDSTIAAETGRNRTAVLYLMEQAACPLGVLGASVATARCGAFDDDLEVARGWSVNPEGTDTAPASARFARANPAVTSSHGAKQVGTTPSGRDAFVTGPAAGPTAVSNDLDGRSSIRSPLITLPAGAGQKLTFAYVFAHSASSTSADSLRVGVQLADGRRVPVFTVLGRAADVDGTWRTAAISMDPFAGQTIRLYAVAEDGGPGNLLEVELDDIRVTRPG
ncbi:MAG TPA: M14 family zinc carboxypeptidase [Candidatus Limnocylindria bacterium]|nr:M14 family zinc carboxypeptidase [Candidatus Limnocylindria bacterium]